MSVRWVRRFEEIGRELVATKTAARLRVTQAASKPEAPESIAARDASPCATCNGTGICPRCNGRLAAEYQRGPRRNNYSRNYGSHHSGRTVFVPVECGMCAKSGECTSCAGSGQIATDGSATPFRWPAPGARPETCPRCGKSNRLNVRSNMPAYCSNCYRAVGTARLIELFQGYDDE